MAGTHENFLCLKIYKNLNFGTGSSSSEQSDMATQRTRVTNLPTPVAVAPVFSVSNPSTRVQSPFQ